MASVPDLVDLTPVCEAMTFDLREMFRKATSNYADTQDLLQELRLKIHERGPVELRDRAKARAYVWSMARNIVADRNRGRKAREARSSDQHADMDVFSDLGATQSAGRNKFTEEEWAWARASLPPRRFEAFQLHHELGMSYKEIANHMGISYGTVAAHLRDAVRDLHDASKQE